MNNFFIRKLVNLRQLTLSFGRFASIEQLEQLMIKMQTLHFALHDTTPEEFSRRKSYQQLLPGVASPVNNELLWAEFTGLARLLYHYGFPQVHTVKMQESDFDFVSEWIEDLTMRFQEWQSEKQM